MKEREEKMLGIANRMVELQKELRIECIGYLTDLLRSKGGSVEFNCADYPFCVAYDGGNHPEYATNLYSTVYGASLNDKGIIEFETEDCDEYNVDRVSTMELWTIVHDIIDGGDDVFETED